MIHTLWLKLAALAWGALLAAAPAWGQTPLRLDAGLDGRPLAPHLAVLEDAGGRLEIAQAASPELAGRFHAWGRAALDLGLTSAAVWVRLALAPGQAEDDGVRVWLLELDKPIIAEIDIYCPVAGPGQAWRRIAAGCERPRPPQAVSFRTNVFTLPADLDLARPLYVRLKSGISLSMQMRLWTGRGLAERVYRDSQVFGVLYGVLGALILFNLVIFFSLRDPAYLAYVCYVAAMLSGQLVLHGQIPAALSMPQPLLPQIQALLLGATMFFAAFFTRQFLDSRVNAPFWDKILNFFLYAPVAMMALAAAGQMSLANSLGYGVAVLGPPHAVCTAAACLRAGFRAARTFLAAWSILLLATVTFILFSLGALPPRPWAPYVLPLLAAWSILLLATVTFILFSLGALPPRPWAPYVLPLGVTLESLL
ncbi:MAG: 7TMR-DISM family protein, partial [Thermodesulfobacteriota bacterium]